MGFWKAPAGSLSLEVVSRTAGGAGLNVQGSSAALSCTARVVRHALAYRFVALLAAWLKAGNSDGQRHVEAPSVPRQSPFGCIGVHVIRVHCLHYSSTSRLS